MSLSVTFDSNVWECVVDEGKRSGVDKTYAEIYKLIRCGEVVPYFFEGIATMETISPEFRKKFYSGYEAGFIVEIDGEEFSNKQGSDGPEITDYLKQNVPKALALGFRFTRIPRFGGATLNIPEEYWAPDSNYPIAERQKRSTECVRFIESLGAGKAKLMNDLDNSEKGFIPRTKQDAKTSDKKYGKGIAEWVDGDALAAHYGYGFDYFCTNDRASEAGTTSIFAEQNIAQLKAKYQIKVVSPEELVSILRN